MQQGLASHETQRPMPNEIPFPPKSPLGWQSSDMSLLPWNLPQEGKLEIPDSVGSIASGDDLLDFTQSDMGWDFDFSTMDLEAFLSVYPSNDVVF